MSRTVAAALALCLILGAVASAQAASTKPGAVIRDCANCPPIVVVPAGTIVIGSSVEEGEREDVQPKNRTLEKPQHAVTIAKAFGLGRFEVTKAEYAAFVRATKRVDGDGCQLWSESSGHWDQQPGKSWHDPGFKQGDNEPVVCVSYLDAVAYADWLSARTGKKYRIPSEAEWEYSARAGAATVRPWGDGREPACGNANVSDLSRADTFPVVGRAPDKVFQCKDGYAYTAPVGKFAANAFGLNDMIGNVWEWVADCTSENYEGAPSDGSPLLSGDCKERGYRGGSWYDPPRNVRAARRVWAGADERITLRGFRVARALD